MIVVYMYSMQLDVLATAVGVGVSTSIHMRHIPTTKKKKRRSWELHGINSTKALAKSTDVRSRAIASYASLR